MSYDPTDDGVTHINIYSKGRTELGQFLSNFFNAPFTLDGVVWASVEGYWYAQSCPPECHPELQRLFGWPAKAYGRAHRLHRTMSEAEFQARIRRACQTKLATYPVMAKAFFASSLPFAHYYVYGGVATRANPEWFAPMWEELRARKGS